MKLLAQRLAIPDDTVAILWDMDGVLLDTLQLDIEIVNGLLDVQLPGCPPVSSELIRDNFGYSTPDFWPRILRAIRIDADPGVVVRLVEKHEMARTSAVAKPHVGVIEILVAGRADGLRMAVVSNNPTPAVTTMLSRAGLLDYFDAIIGNDVSALASKPAPDMYLEATRRLSVDPAQCVAIEDSLLGAEAGHRAGCYTIGVATGAQILLELKGTPFVNSAYANLDLIS